MEENLNPIPEEPQVPVMPKFTAQGHELVFGGVIALLSVLMCNFVLFRGFNLGFSVAAVALILCSWIYLKKAGSKFGWYEKALLVLSLVIALGFARSDDSFVKFIMLLFLFTAVNLALCLAAGQNRRAPQGAMSLLDAPRAFFRLGMGNLSAVGKSLAAGIRRGGAATRRVGAVGVGLLISAPILAIMIGLLMGADAAFEGLMDLLPDMELGEYITSAFWGVLLAWILYSRGVSLAQEKKPDAASRKGKGVNALTVNTVLCMVCVLYVVYLLSQLAYFSGGLSGILPEEYTLAEYARRGFFEMSWLCTINLGLLCGSIWLIRTEGNLPKLTKITGAFIGGITIFLVVTASAKMFLYIGSYGLTWARVITEVIMLWLALTTILVTIRLFLPKFGYMKAVVLSAMVLGALTFWVDVNSLVARYNVGAYRGGKLETVDVSHLGTLGSAAVPYLLELAEDADPAIAQEAKDLLSCRNWYTVEDFRDWNYSRATGDRLLRDYQAAQEEEVAAYVREQTGVDISGGTIFRSSYFGPRWEEDDRMVQVNFAFEERQALTEQLQAAGWEKLPLSVPMRTLLNKEPQLFAEFRDTWINDSAAQGYWLFKDLHKDAKDPADPSQVLEREEYHFLAAYYKANTGTLLIYEVRCPAEESDA